MAKLTKTSLFKAQSPTAETAMDKTTRVVRRMLDEETERRHVKIERLRTAQLERDANASADATPATAKRGSPKAVMK